MYLYSVYMYVGGVVVVVFDFIVVGKHEQLYSSLDYVCVCVCVYI